ncbi:lung adenoma susceptibility protein 2 isoform X2 [Boleophthalmus pectinirostris]|uniref:lung adenoma susceptibility protein 2 isoform X2 n=1 Tax=Boleophthalmus pectinirostris TaxID=150288 RepID=UPI00242A52EC|nr:lung adenoma susceptibility protein 2 isoform X2 [Boleophthalmus pectinirostris]
MCSSVRSGDTLSPESTVTSLLSSSGHLTSNLQPSLHNTSFTYKNKEYESASAALDAYITDFERSRHGNTPKGAGLGLPLCSAHRSTLSTLRNRDVLRERLSEQELDFLTLPVSSLRHRDNRDRVSMTTDELLSLPNDGSMPITHTSAFLHGLVSKSRLSQVRSPVKNTCSHSLTHRGSSQPIRALHCSRCGGGLQSALTTPLSSTLKPGPEAPSSRWAGLASAPRPDWPSSRDQVTMHLPHWLSSNKAALDCSDIHSLPDLPYPPWIRHCDAGQSERSSSLQDGQSERAYGQGQSQPAESQDYGSFAPSWVQELHDDQVDSEEALKSLRLHFAQRISHTSPDSTHYRDRRLESLIQKADQVLDSLQNSATGSPVPPVQTHSPDPQSRPTVQTHSPEPQSRTTVQTHSPDPQSRPTVQTLQVRTTLT